MLPLHRLGRPCKSFRQWLREILAERQAEEQRKKELLEERRLQDLELQRLRRQQAHLEAQEL